MQKLLTKSEIMSDNGRLLSNLFNFLKNFIKPGASTMFIEKAVALYFKKHNCQKAIEGPYYSNVCLNNIITHGVPSESQILSSGDILTVDVVLKKNNLNVDSSYTYGVGKISDEDEYLISSARQLTLLGISAVKVGKSISEIGNMIYYEALKRKIKVYYQFTGHGIGERVHMAPKIPHWYNNYDSVITKDLFFTIEPIVTFSDIKVKSLKDGSYEGLGKSAQFEHTICISDGILEVVTL